MRPINRGAAPAVYTDYEDAKQDLTNRLGSYCSYCERRLSTYMAVEHIQPKSLVQYQHLELEWTNFLLSCVNCNSAKLTTPVECDSFLLPDRDNTFIAFIYEETGMVTVSMAVPPSIQQYAIAARDLVALNRTAHPDWDEDVMFSALGRIGQRVQAWVQAKDALDDFQDGITCPRAIAREAASAGFFSIWMAAFTGFPEVRRAIIDIFPNTADDCFDINTDPISPRPSNGLAHGGKI